MTQEVQTKGPDLFIYTKIPDGRGDRIGSRIGVAFQHKEKMGFTLYLDAQPIPLDGRIQLIAFPPKEEDNVTV